MKLPLERAALEKFLKPDLASLKAIRRYDLLDCFRGFLAILIVAYHCRLAKYFPWYWGAMDFFFVMSGVLITRTLVIVAQKDEPVLRFFIYRVTRLMPAMLVLCGGYAAIAGGTHSSAQAAAVLPYLLLYQNLDLMIWGEEVFPRVDMLLHVWSLVLEEHFYVVWGLLAIYWGVKRRLTLGGLVFGMLLALIYSAWYRNTGGHWWVLPGRLDGFLVGSVMGLLIFANNIELPRRAVLNWYRRLYFAIVALSAGRLLSSAWLSYVDHEIYQTGVTRWLDVSCYAILASFIIWLFMVYENPSSEPGRVRQIFRFFGKLSYELYLFHVPVLYFWKMIMEFRGPGSSLQLFAQVLLLSTILAYFANKYLTEPALRNREQLMNLLLRR